MTKRKKSVRHEKYEVHSRIVGDQAHLDIDGDANAVAKVFEDLLDIGQEAERDLAQKAVARAIAGGMNAELAERLYGFRPKPTAKGDDENS